MENASKALIIAGAILLAILIIALGVYKQVEAHNATFQNYEGTINGTQAKALIDAIRNNNSRMDTNAQITVEGQSDLSTFKSNIETSKQYVVKITGYQSAEGPYKGYVTKMSITAKS